MPRLEALRSPSQVSLRLVRFEPAYLLAAAALQHGFIGDVLLFSADGLSLLPPEAPIMEPTGWRMATGEWMKDIAMHYAAALRRVLGPLRLLSVVPLSTASRKSPLKRT